MASSLIRPVSFSLINAIFGKGVMTAGNKTRRWTFSSIRIAFSDKSSGEWSYMKSNGIKQHDSSDKNI